MEVKRFPIYKSWYIFNKFNGKKKECKLIEKKELELLYPCRLDAMAINPAAVCYNDKMIFTPGEVVIKPSIFIKVNIRLVSENGGKIIISDSTKRKVLVKHSYFLMCDALGVSPSIEIDVDDKMIPKHCGFGSSSSTIAAVAAAINELYNNPIESKELIKYLASNHGEEIDNNDEDLKMVQCIGGGATGGLSKGGIIIIAGQSTTIAKMNYFGKILIGIPKDFQQKSAKELMELEEDNLWKFKRTGQLYSERIAYDLLHKALPGMKNNSIRELANVVFDYRFNMGSIDNCSFVYEKMRLQAKKLRKLYEEGDCDFLALSSVGPAFFAIVSDGDKLKKCIDTFENANFNVIETEIFNDNYIVTNRENKDFWKKEETVSHFTNRKPSKYITDEIDALVENNTIEVLDIGCGGGRYSRYIQKKKSRIIGIDKNIEMAAFLKENKIPFIEASFDNIPLFDESCDLILSIGVLHNATTNEQYNKAIEEMHRLLRKKGKVIFSVFTDDIITDDLISKGNDLYDIKNRPSMVLHSKKKINDIVMKNGFKIKKIIDEHITDVGSGKRNVYTILLVKE